MGQIKLPSTPSTGSIPIFGIPMVANLVPMYTHNSSELTDYEDALTAVTSRIKFLETILRSDGYRLLKSIHKYLDIDEYGSFPTIPKPVILRARDKRNNVLEDFIEKYGGKKDTVTISWASETLEWLEDVSSWDDKTAFLEASGDIHLWKGEWEVYRLKNYNSNICGHNPISLL
jgi:hypothetical protein